MSSKILESVQKQNRRQMFEYEVYELLQQGGIAPPRHVFVATGQKIDGALLKNITTERVVLKVVSAEIVHKTEAGGVVFVENKADAIEREIRRMEAGLAKHGRVEGVLVVECVTPDSRGFGSEMFVGIRATREFGPIIVAGVGGIDTEYLAKHLKSGLAMARASAIETTPEEFLQSFKKTTSYEVLSGLARGRKRAVSDEDLLRCFRAFIGIAREYGIHRDGDQPMLEEMEVNPFAFSGGKMIPLDGRGRLGNLTPAPAARPIEKIKFLLEPRAAAVIGASAKRMNFGRIILNNIKACGFPTEHLYAIKDDVPEIDGIRCIPNIRSLPEPVDLLVLATAAEDAEKLMDEMINTGKVQSVIIIPGGVGEKEGTEDLQRRLAEMIVAGHQRPDGGPVFVGGNCLGIVSRPGKYDTFFIPEGKLDPRRNVSPRRCALISQSGAFIISRVSNLESLDPTLSISFGNQTDLTISDFLKVVGRRSDVDCLGVYVEGFKDMDGLEFLRAVKEVVRSGKTMVFYKAGRTAAGRSATAGHTASVAGDYDVCDATVSQAGAIAAETFKEFEQMVDLATALHGKQIRGTRIAAISNAGYETVGMADSVKGERFDVTVPNLSAAVKDQLLKVLAKHRLDSLVNARNPLDLTPMASDEAYEDCMKTLLESDEFDALVVAMIPLTPQMLTIGNELEKPTSIAHRIVRLFRESPKPIVAVVDSGSLYNPLVRVMKSGGVPVFRSADWAVRTLGRFLRSQ